MSAPTTELVQVVLTVVRAPAQTIVHEDKKLVIPADEIHEFIDAAKLYFEFLTGDPIIK